MAVVESPTFTGSLLSLRVHGRARDRRAGGRATAWTWTRWSRCWPATRCGCCALQTACQNPMGVDLSPERRERLAELAVERNLFVLEDRVYADLRYEGERRPAAARARHRGT